MANWRPKKVVRYLVIFGILFVTLVLGGIGCQSTQHQPCAAGEVRAKVDQFILQNERNLESAGDEFLSGSCWQNSDSVGEFEALLSEKLDSRCHLSNGSTLGKMGKKPDAICANPHYRKRSEIHAYQVSYKAGLELFRVESQKDLVRMQIDQVKEELLRSGLSEYERSGLNSQLNELNKQYSTLNRQSDQLINRGVSSTDGGANKNL